MYQFLNTMNTHRNIARIPIIMAAATMLLAACRKEETSGPSGNAVLTEQDKTDLLFMLEEEKLARDTYTALEALWSSTQFVNIKSSEQTHMDRIADLLNTYDVPYVILPEGEFANATLQALFDQFMVDGSQSELHALRIGATIEDLDIVDLQERMDATTTTSVDRVYGKLQCGSRNHLRSFVDAINSAGGSYAPQYLEQDAYDTILAGDHESCG
ncbi:MAG: DUF2202 domain-containing protein [Flavobacteriales bacterium]|nr:DUF2202 domain-containing protein [Flavobacteriales bacterium]